MRHYATNRASFISLYLFGLLLIYSFNSLANQISDLYESDARVASYSPSLSPVKVARNHQVHERSWLAVLNIPFIENVGQAGNHVKYYATTFAGDVFITHDGEIIYSIPNNAGVEFNPGPISFEPSKAPFIKEILLNRNPNALVDGEIRTTTDVSYFKGNQSYHWLNNIATFSVVKVGDVYNGIDMTLKAYGDNVEKIFHIQPNADPDDIHVEITGIDNLHVNATGELELATKLGTLSFAKPVAYQEEEDGQRYIDIAYKVAGKAYGFEIGNYDQAKELVIDPIISGTFLGGTNSDVIQSLAINSVGDIYVAGTTLSPDFSTTAGALDTALDGTEDVFIARLDNNLTTLLASSYLGGADNDTASATHQGLVISSVDDSVYVTGKTKSTDFPTTIGAFDTSYNGGRYDAYVAKLDSNLQNLLAATLLGGGADDVGQALQIDLSGDLYIAGFTESSGFPTSAGAFDTSFNGGDDDIFVSKFDADLETLPASTFLGGSQGTGDNVQSMYLDSDGSVIVGGNTSAADFPITPGAYDNMFDGISDFVVARLDGNLQNLIASTFIGGSDLDVCVFVTKKANGNILCAGYTRSSNFATTSGAYDITFNGATDVAVTELDATLQNLIGSTVLGGGSIDTLRSAVVDGLDNVYLTGSTQSLDFPTTTGALDTDLTGTSDIFVSTIDSTLQNLVSSTFLGGSSDDGGEALRLHVNGDIFVYVGGSTSSSDFPVDPSGYDISYNAGQDGFIAKLRLDNGTSVPSVVCEGFEPPLQHDLVTVNKNKVLPLKAQLIHQGAYLTNQDLVMPPVLQVTFDSGSGEAVDVTDEALPAGQGTEGNQFEFDGAQWHFNLKTKNYTSPGIYTISMVSGDDSEYTIDPKCTVQFAISG